MFISAALAARDDLNMGQPLTLVVNEGLVTLEIAGIIPATADGPKAPATLLVMDLPALQALTGRTGALSRIEFIVPNGPAAQERRTELKAQLERSSQGRWIVSSPVDRRESAATMTRAFRVNLTILSLIALLVGLYLIFQALDGAVVRRREEIGILRSLGVEERWIRGAWLLEAGGLGVIGGALGALLGWAGAQFSVRLVGRTVNALYYSTSVQSAQLDWTELAIALLLAIVSSLLAGWMPARAAAQTPPAQILIRHALAPPGLSIWRKEWLGLLVALAGFGLATLPPLRFSGGLRFPLAGYLAGLCWILGGGILSGWALRTLARVTRPLGHWLLPVKLAAGHLVQPSGRHRLAVAGLVCAIAMTAGMAILVASFDTTMRGWIERTFHADLYIASSGAQSASTENRISPETWKAIAKDPAVQDINIAQAAGVRLPGGQTVLTGGELQVAHRHTRFSWVQPPLSNDIFLPERNAGLALVSESFSERFLLKGVTRSASPPRADPKSSALPASLLITATNGAPSWSSAGISRTGSTMSTPPGSWSSCDRDIPPSRCALNGSRTIRVFGFSATPICALKFCASSGRRSRSPTRWNYRCCRRRGGTGADLGERAPGPPDGTDHSRARWD